MPRLAGLLLLAAIACPAAAGAQVVRGPVDTFADTSLRTGDRAFRPDTPRRDTDAASNRPAAQPRATPDRAVVPGAEDDFRQYDLVERDAELRRLDGLDDTDTDEVALEPPDLDGPPPVLAGPDDDPYAPLGLRIGSVLLFPALETRLEYSDNVDERAIDPESGMSYVVAPSLELRSDWARHALGLDAGVSYETFDREGIPDAVEVELDGDLRLDLSDVLRLDLDASFERERNRRDGVVDRLNEDTTEFGAALRRTFGAWFGQIGAAFVRETRESGVRADGTPFDNSDRDRDEVELALRIGHALDPQWQVFGDVLVNERVFDRAVDDNGFLRGSRGWGVAGGVVFDRGGPLRVELRLGYQQQDPEDPRLETVRGLIADGEIAWRPSGLTTLTLSAATAFDETVTAGASGIRDYVVALELVHDLRRYLTVTGTLAYEIEDFVGIDSAEREFTADAEIAYALRRGISIFADIGYTRFEGDGIDEDYEATTIGLGARLSR